jgi:Glycoside-hydrolase family GH114
VVFTAAAALVASIVASITTPLIGSAGTAATPSPPPVNANFDYQLGGAYPPPDGVRVVTRDRTAQPADTAYNICYVNGYQTQPGRLTWWKRTHSALLLRDRGQLVHDPGWPGEVLLDTSTAAKRQGIADVVGRWIAGCAADGFDAVEPDNLDSYTRSRHLLDRAGALSLAVLLSRRAHRAGLAIAQKNLAGLTRARRVAVGFDFAVSEECAVWNECGAYRRAYGRHVIEIEYTDNGRAAFRRACRDHGDAWSIVLRDRMLRTPASPRYTFQLC